jgi:KaiC/GvpD/RAD55 family RecA-like ATPase
MLDRRIINFFTYRDFMKDGAFPPPDPVVEGLLNKSQLTLISATAKTGKTWFALHLAMSVAYGRLFLGAFPTRKGKVLMIQTEVSMGDFKERVTKIERDYVEMDQRGEYPIFAPDRIRLDSPEGLKLFQDSVAEIMPSLVILDSWYTFHSKDESSSKDMAPLLSEVRDIAKKNECSVLIVHHQGKRGEGGQASQVGHNARGSSSFADVPDNLLSLSRKSGGELCLSFDVRNQKGRDPMVLRFDRDKCKFDIISETDINDSIDAVLVDYVTKQPGIKKSQIVQQLKEKTGKSERTIEASISLGIKAGRIIRTSEGREACFHPSNIENSNSQNRSSLGDCELASIDVEGLPEHDREIRDKNMDGSLFDNPALERSHPSDEEVPFNEWEK